MREFLLASRNVLRQQRRSVVALIAIAVGVAALTFAGGFIEWILRELREQTIRTQLGHIQVRPAASTSGAAREGDVVYLPSGSPELARIARAAHVVSVAPRLSLSGLISHEGTTLAFIGDGVDPKLDIIARNADDLLEGKLLNSTTPNGILVGEGLAASLGVRPGDKAVVLVNLPGGGINASDVIVMGTFRTVSKSYDEVAIRVPLQLAQSLVKTRGADLWVVDLDHTESTATALSALRDDPTLRNLTFVPWTDLADFYNKAVVLYARQFHVMQALIAIIIVLSIMNTMTMNVTGRTSEIGTMMAIGTPRGSILRMFLFEGLMLGLIGGLLGLALGYAVNLAVSAIGIPMPPPPGMRHGFLAGASFDLDLAIPALLLAVATTTIASVYPAVRASRLVIVDALRTAR